MNEDRNHPLEAAVTLVSRSETLYSRAAGATALIAAIKANRAKPSPGPDYERFVSHPESDSLRAVDDQK